MKRIILFRYHKKPLICRNRLLQLKKLNPTVKIFGLYGGEEINFPKYKKALEPFLEHNYCLKNKTKDWRWRNGDLGIRLWYKAVGNKINFEMLHFIEWDLLLVDSLDKIYKKIPKNCVGLTALTPLKNVESRWNWTSKEPMKSEWLKLLKYVKKRFKYSKQPYASLGPGSCLPKKFLDKYSSINVPELCHDELRLPLFGQIFDFKLIDTGFHKKWFDEEQNKKFTCGGGYKIILKTVKEELKKKNGARAFHPYRKKYIF